MGPTRVGKPGPNQVGKPTGVPNSSVNAWAVRFFDSELPDIQVHDDRCDAWPVLHGGIHPGRRLCPGPGAATALAFDQLMLGHLDRDRGDVEQLTAKHRTDRGISQIVAAARARHRFMHNDLVRVLDLAQCRAGMAGLPPGLRPDLRRNDFGIGFLPNGESVLGGLLEFCESWPSRARNASFWARSSTTCVRSRAFSASTAVSRRRSSSTPISPDTRSECRETSKAWAVPRSPIATGIARKLPLGVQPVLFVLADNEPCD